MIRRLVHVPVNPFQSNGPEFAEFRPLEPFHWSFRHGDSAAHNNMSDNKLSPVVDPQVSHFIQVPLAAMKCQ